jgi:hypothetical protein
MFEAADPEPVYLYEISMSKDVPDVEIAAVIL